MPAAAVLSWVVRRLVLAPLGLEGLQLLALCLVLALLVLLPARGRAALLLPQALVNCAVLGVGLASAGAGPRASLATGPGRRRGLPVGRGRVRRAAGASDRE